MLFFAHDGLKTVHLTGPGECVVSLWVTVELYFLHSTMTLVLVASGGVFFSLHFVVWVVFQLDSDVVFAHDSLKTVCVTGTGECEVSLWATVEL